MWLRVILKKDFKGNHNLVVRRMKSQEHEQMHTIESIVVLCKKLEHGLLLRHMPYLVWQLHGEMDGWSVIFCCLGHSF
jgi:hypothetical protein